MDANAVFLISGIFVLILFLAIFWLIQKNRELSQGFGELAFAKSSQSVKYGKTTEQWIPLSSRFPLNRQKFRFLGNPIDGIAFEENKIVFCEFKTAGAKLSENQQAIKKLVQDKKVEWLELRADEK